MELYKYNKEKLDFILINRPLYLLKYIGITLGICLTVVIFSSMQYINSEKVRFIKSESVINLITNETFSKEKFFAEIDRSNFAYPEIIKAQALIESQHFSSPVWKENNNALGMRKASTRFTVAIGDNLNHAVYSNWKDCIKDRLIYEAVYLNKLSKQEYFAFLDKVYARAKTKTAYSNLIKTIIKQQNL